MRTVVHFIKFFLLNVIFFCSFQASAGVTPTETLNDCIKANLIIPPTGTWYWSVDVIIKNVCTEAVELREAKFSIESPFLPSEIRMSFDSSGMSWANTVLEQQTKGTTVPDYPFLNYYANTLSLAYSSDSWLVTKINPNGVLKLTFASGLPQSATFTSQMAEVMTASFKVFTGGQDTPPDTIKGSIRIQLGDAPVLDINFPKQANFVVNGPNNFQKTLSLNWGAETVINDLTLGLYTVQSANIEYNNAQYQAQLPDSINLSESNTDSSITANYVKQSANTGIIHLNLGQAPKDGLNAPVIRLTDLTANTLNNLTVQWGQSLAVNDMPADHQYQIEAQAIDGYTRTAQPSNFTLQSGSTVDVAIDYMVTAPTPSLGKVSLTINGLPADQSASISFINNETQQKNNMLFGNGLHEVSLAQGIYTVEAAPVASYRALLTNGTNPVSVVENSSVPIAFTYQEQPQTAGSKRIVAYFTSWGIYGRNYQVTDIPALKVTDINYAFLNISNGQCVLGDSWADVDKRYPAVTTSLGVFPEDSWSTPTTTYFGNFNRLNKMRELAAQKGHKINLFLSVGGWTWSKYFSDVAASSTAREKFVNSCIAIMNKYDFDGIDLDWEYPVGGGLSGNSNRPEDKQNYTLLLQLFREKLGTGKLLTIAAPAGPSIIPNLEWNKIGQYLDWVNLMSYDFHGGWENVTGHNAPLYTNPTDPGPATLNADAAINRIESLGFPINKLVMGVGFYGRGWQSVASTNNGLFQSGTMTSFGTWENGVFDYYDVLNSYLSISLRFYDIYSKVPYLYDLAKGVFISYEDPESMTIKANYILNRGLAGVMFWELSGDVRNSDSEQSLLGTLFNLLVA